MIRRAAILALWIGARIAAAQTGGVVELRDAGPGPGPALVAGELAQPYAVVAPAPARYVVRRDTLVRRTLIVLGRDTYVEGKVQGDVVVIGGDLYMHPGGAISGRAIAVGGGVYESELASTGGVLAFRDFTYDITPIPGGYALSYRSLVARDSTALQWPGAFGLRLPSYERTDGLSLPFGPMYHVQNTGVTVDPHVTYRSQLGRFDPGLEVIDSLGRRTELRLVAERTTMSNERWIWSDPVNSVNYLVGGWDMREYYRAARAKLTASRRWESANGSFAPYIGALYERAESVRPGPNATSSPWTFFNRHDRDDPLRPNPSFPDTRILSALAGAQWNWTENGITAEANGGLEAGSPTFACNGCFGLVSSSFAQATIDGRIEFPTFGDQTFAFRGHGVVTMVGETPVDRYAYLGGPGSIPTLEPLSLFGNELLFLDFRYNIPISTVQLPSVGPPTLSLREVLGGAEINRFPTIHQSVGARLSASVLYGELMLDPVARRLHFGVGISIGR